MSRRSYPRPDITKTESSAQLIAFLYDCRPSALGAVTVDQLVARHRVDRKRVEYELNIARQKRAGELA